MPARVTLLREISDGPVAALYAAESRQGSQRELIAVKVLHRHPTGPGRAQGPDPTRSLEIGRRLASLHHGHIVCATEVAWIGDAPALLAPWVEGIDLLDWLGVLRGHHLSLPGRVICEPLRSVAVALDAALNRTPWGEVEPLGIFHHDLKPSNIMISREGQIKVLDFGAGLTSLWGLGGLELAHQLGLDRYLCPEGRQQELGAAVDVYALGILGVELCRGRWLRRPTPRNPDHDRALAEIVAHLPDPGLRSEADERTLRALLLRMVAFDPEARPAAVEIAQTLRTLADRAPGASLETFAHQHALPYLEPPLPHPGLPGLQRPSPIRALPDTQQPPQADPTTGPERLGTLTAAPPAEHPTRAHPTRAHPGRPPTPPSAPPPSVAPPSAPPPTWRPLFFGLIGGTSLGALAMLLVVTLLILIGVLLFGP
ncbi:MAG TPA: hypothetical protein ENK18_26210 [Deltaproteobacteria bacterium]|nr:hypothetical protein [Deltaproteobacteria bacterium]